MKKIALSLCAVALFSFISAKEISGFKSPESIMVHNDVVYVSNVGEKLEPMLKDNDGFISKLRKNGEIIELKFISNLDAPKGMQIINNVLYVADVDRVKGFDLNSKKQVFSQKFENANFLNDLATKNENTLFVSSTDANAIYELDLKSKSYKKLVDLTAANGLFDENGILYTVHLGGAHLSDGLGEVYKIDLKNKNKITKISNTKGVLDGVHKIGNKLYVSDWGSGADTGVIKIIDLKTGKEEVLKTGKFGGAADFIIDEKTNKLYMPQMIASKISIVNLNK